MPDGIVNPLAVSPDPPNILDPFFTSNRPGEGTGLGISVVYGIVSGYGGIITVQSQPVAGTTFSVYLPAIQEIAEAAEITAQAIQVLRADSDSFDLFITDMTMRGMTGVEPSREIFKIKANILSSFALDTVSSSPKKRQKQF